MAELTFKSAGVSTREIDLSGPTAVKPQGTPAGVIGTSQKGPAFVPVTVATYQDFVAEFGGTDGKKFGPLAMNEWMKNARAGTFVRVLGVGDGKKRGTDGEVAYGGFVVGAPQPQDTDDPTGPGILGNNPYAGVDTSNWDNDDDTVTDDDQGAGRTYFLGALMREAYGDEGGVAATSTLVLANPSSYVASDFTDSQYGKGLRFTDSVDPVVGTQESLTIWLHEGADDDTNVDGTDISGGNDSRNVTVAVGSRAAVDLSITDATAANIDNRVLELTDVAGNVLTITFDNGSGQAYDDEAAGLVEAGIFSADPDVATGTSSVTLDVSTYPGVESAEAELADMIHATIDESQVQMEPEAKAASDEDFIIRLNAFGAAADEPDGGTLTGATPNIALRLASDGVTATTDFAGGLYRTAAQLAAAMVSRVGAQTLAADLSVSSVDNGGGTADFVVTQGTTGTAGNENDGTADAGNASVSYDWVHDVITITNPVSGMSNGDNLVIQDLNPEGVADDSVAFIADDTVADGRANDLAVDPIVVGIAPSAPAESRVTFTEPAAAFHTGDQLVFLQLDSDGLVDITLTIDVVEIAGGTSYVANAGGVDAVDNVSVQIDLTSTDGGASGDTTAEQLLAALNCANGIVGVDGNIGTQAATTAFSLVSSAGDMVSIVQNEDGPKDSAVGDLVSATSLTESADVAITVEDAGHIQQTDAAAATVIAAQLGSLRLRVVDDAAGALTVEQVVAGAATTAATDDGGITAIVTAGAGDLGTGVAGVAGTEPAGLAVGDFTGGGDTGEDPAPEHSVWADAGIDTSVTGPLGGAWPIIRAVMHTPQGVRPSLVCDGGHSVGAVARAAQAPAAYVADAVPPNVGAALPAPPAGGQLGSVYIDGVQERFVMMLNGHTNTPEYPNVLTASMDPTAPDYFMNVFNHDPACIEKAGHYVYTHYNVYQSYATVDGEGTIVDQDGSSGHTETAADGRLVTDAAFVLHGRSNIWRDAVAAVPGSDTPDVIDYESCEDRYRTARSPWVVSQDFGGKPKNLFRLWALDDGVAGSGKFKLSIEGVMMDPNSGFGTFDLLVRRIDDDDVNVVAYEKFFGLDLNPSSDRYIARVIGDLHTWYDFDKREGSQKLVVDGIHPNRSKYIRVEMDPEVDAGTVAAEALPMGYRGYWHLWTDAFQHDYGDASGGEATFLENVAYDDLLPLNADGLSPLCRAKVPPVPMRQNISQGTGLKKRADSSLYWGTMFQVDDDQEEPNKNLKFNDSILSYGRYFPMYHSSSANPWQGDNEGAEDLYNSVVDADRFNNNFFSLERIQVVTKNPATPSSKNPSVMGKVDGKQWSKAEYRRDNALNNSIQTLEGINILDTDGTPHADVLTTPGDDTTATIGSRFLDPKTDLIDPSIRRFAKFSFFMQGGFDGTGIYQKEKNQLLNQAANWEMEDANQGGTSGATVAAYRKAIDVMAEKADVDIKLLAIPGLRNEAVTDYAIDAVEDRFDAMYIMDVEERSVDNELMLDYSSQKPGVNLTVENFSGRNLDTSFAAAYFPDVVITDPATQTNVQCPPSVAVLGAFSLNDSVAHPWFAPAGFTRGALRSVVETQVKLSRVNLDTLYESDVNPLAAFPHTPGVVVWGQKTLQQAKSALDRVNVRRLLIEIRREVRRVGNTLLFEPNRAETLARFSASVNPILQRIQAQQGLDKFKVIIDTTTTTQADIENNTVRGKIFLQPTRTVEFISLDFVVTNAGMEV